MKDIKDNKSYTDNLRSQQMIKSRSPGQYQSPTRVQIPSSPEVEPYGQNIYSNEKKLRFNNY